jgi:hypothetical protein
VICCAAPLGVLTRKASTECPFEALGPGLCSWQGCMVEAPGETISSRLLIAMTGNYGYNIPIGTPCKSRFRDIVHGIPVK